LGLVEEGVGDVSYSAGDYFGAVSLLMDAPQPRTIVATGGAEAVVLSLERRAFKRLVAGQTAATAALREILMHGGQEEGGSTPQ
jgi:CRP-like cAMP-binding protein